MNSVDRFYTFWDILKLIATIAIIACIVIWFFNYLDKIDQKQKDIAYQEGYEQGYAEAEAEYEGDYDSGYQAGIYDGYQDGYEDGYDNGYTVAQDEYGGD